MSNKINPVDLAQLDLDESSEVYMDLQMLEGAIDTLMGVQSEAAVEINLSPKQAARIVADSVYVDPEAKDLDSIRTFVVTRKYKQETIVENYQRNLDGLKLNAYDRAIDMIHEELRFINAVTRGDSGTVVKAERLMKSSRKGALEKILNILTCNDQNDDE